MNLLSPLEFIRIKRQSLASLQAASQAGADLRDHINRLVDDFNEFVDNYQPERVDDACDVDPNDEVSKTVADIVRKELPVRAPVETETAPTETETAPTETAKKAKKPKGEK